MTDYLIVMLISLVRSVLKHFVDSCLLIFVNHSLFIFMLQHNKHCITQVCLAIRNRQKHNTIQTKPHDLPSLSLILTHRLRENTNKMPDLVVN